MITLVLPATNHKPTWIEIRADGQHIGKVWGQVDDLTMEKGVGQFMVAVTDDGRTQAYIWADQITKTDQ